MGPTWLPHSRPWWSRWSRWQKLSRWLQKSLSVLSSSDPWGPWEKLKSTSWKKSKRAHPDRLAPATMPVTAGKNTENTCDQAIRTQTGLWIYWTYYVPKPWRMLGCSHLPPPCSRSKGLSTQLWRPSQQNPWHAPGVMGARRCQRWSQAGRRWEGRAGSSAPWSPTPSQRWPRPGCQPGWHSQSGARRGPLRRWLRWKNRFTPDIADDAIEVRGKLVDHVKKTFAKSNDVPARTRFLERM